MSGYYYYEPVLSQNLPPATSVYTLNYLNQPSGQRKECNLTAEPGFKRRDVLQGFVLDENFSKEKLSKSSKSYSKTSIY